jgi:uncharacterized protein YabN with tetrapyrrole methylase and pyrophosphatase domain
MFTCEHICSKKWTSGDSKMGLQRSCALPHAGMRPSLNGCPWDEKTYANAAKNGHLEVLKYAQENGCPWDKKYCMNNAKNKEMIDWLELQP